MKRFLIISLFVLFLPAELSLADIPQMINYQGMLTDNSVTPLSGSYNLTFKIWTDTTGGSSLWTEIQNGVQVQNGLFNVILGKATTLNLPFDQQYWLEVGVGAETMPRVRFTSVGYAFRAKIADSATVVVSGPSEGGWTDDGTVIRLTVGTDSVGIGSNDPQHKLHVVDTSKVNNAQAIYGESSSPYTGSAGIYGYSSATGTGGVYGVYGKTADRGYGVLGVAVGEGVGVAGSSPAGTGGEFWSGGDKGIYGWTNTSAPSGSRAVYGYAAKTSGLNYAFYGETNSPDGYAGYFKGGLNYFEGKTGIGTTQPEVKLDVSDVVRVRGRTWPSSGKGMELGYDSTSNRGYIQVYDRDPGGGWGMLYLGNGEVGIGTINPANKLTVSGGVSVGSGYTTTVTPSNGMIIEGSVAIGTTSPGTFNLAVNGSAAKPGGGSWSTFSDVRLKDVQANYKYGLSEISRLNPVRYRYREGNTLGLPWDEDCVGLVAQDVQEVIPDAVTSDDNGYLMLNNDPVIWAMLNAIKELKAENEVLKKRIEALETK